MRVIARVAGVLRAFEEPEQVIVARSGVEVDPAFEAIEAALERGRYVAGYASYELGAHFVPRQGTPERGVLPLLACGVYGAPGPVPDSSATYALAPLEPAVDLQRYEADVAQILRAIRDGDVYQVNYSVPFEVRLEGDPYALFSDLLARGSCPYAAFVDTPAHAIVSASPELFMQFGRGRIVTKPMKGTASVAAAEELAGAKNRAEHIMIVDLLRNDVHRIGSDVSVERLCEVERYPHFATMTSTIAGTIPPDIRLRELFAAMFPCGSVTGAPKVAAMNVIARTERRPRDMFCGTIGYIAPDRSGCWNVAIRTATIDKATGRGRLDVGGGIVADSTARGEWEEIVTKLAPFAALARAMSPALR